MESASKAFDQALGKDPRDASALLGAVTLLVQKGRIEEAESRVKEFQREAPDAPSAQLALAQIAFRKKDLKLAGDLLDAASARPPREPTFYVAAAHLYRNLGRSYRGQRLLRKAWQEGMRDAEVLQLLGSLSLKMMSAEQAEAAFRAALESGAESAEIRRNLGRALFMRDRKEEAAREFETALQLDPSDPHS
ncbi:MAG: tetratricopeptide repeat protein, partial [Acidobacteria bacterium]|nr:tetratricopeptide repeat protein [Acidobacteriota bacterium]